MPRYFMFIKHSPNLREDEVPQSLHEEMGEFAAEGFKSGVLIETGGLQRVSESFEVRQSKRRITVIDGPYAESKEVVGGYAVVEVGSRQEARDLAVKFMDLHLRHMPDFEGACEVRAIEGGPSAPADEVRTSDVASG